MNEEEFLQWQKEVYDATFSLDVEKFKEFYTKWKIKGVYTENLPVNDYVIEICLRKIILASTEATREQKEEAKRWLKERGFSEKL